MFKFRRKVNIGKVNLKPNISKKTLKGKEGSKLKVVKKDNKVLFYQKIDEKNGIKINLSREAKQILKEYPDIYKFIKKELISRIIEKEIIYENNKLKINLKPYYTAHGSLHSGLYKMNILFKDKKSLKKYFVKLLRNETNNTYIHNEFLASKVFEKFGLQTIRPHFSFNSKTHNNNIIIYDFSNFHTLSDLTFKKNLSRKIQNKIIKEIENIEKYSKEIGLHTSKNIEGIDDYLNPANIFVDIKKDKYEVYFTDLLLRESYKFNVPVD